MRTFNRSYSTLTLLSILFWVSAVQTVTAQSWQSLNGPANLEPGSVTFPGSNLLALGDTLYYIPMDGAVFKRRVTEDQWIVATTHNPNSYRAFTIDEVGNRYMANHGTVFPSDPIFSRQDVAFAEEHNPVWTIIRDVFNKEIFTITVTQNGMALFGGNGIYRLSDNRESLIAIDTLIAAIEFHQYGDTLLAAGRGISFSVDSGQTWTQQDEELNFLRTITSLDETIITATNNQIFVKEILQSEAVEIPNTPDGNFHALHTAGDNVFLGTDAGIYSVDPDEQTVSERFPDLSDRAVFSIESSGDMVFAATDAGMYSCLISHKSCRPDPAPVTNTQLVTYWNGNGLLVANRNRILLYNEENQEWTTIFDQLSSRATNFHLISENKFLVSAGSTLYRCSLQQTVCDQLVDPDPNRPIVQITETADGSLILSTADRVLLSEDGGTEWEPIYVRPMEEFSHIRDLLAYDASLLLIARNDSLVRYEISEADYSIAEYDQNSFIVMNKYGDNLLLGSDGYSLFKSSDAGQSWNSVLNLKSVENLSGSLRTILTDESSGKIYLQFSSSVILVSDDEGENWGMENSLYPLRVDHSAINDNGDLFLASTGAGVFKNSIPINPPITISNEEEPETDVPNEFTLHQNYPNPFNPSTTITYSLPEPAEARLTVYNMVGQQVAVLLNGVQNRGVHTVQFDAGHLASGLYLYRLEIGNYSETRKMMLVK